MGELKVIVAGERGSGKTTIAKLIRDALVKHQIGVEVLDDHPVFQQSRETLMQRQRVDSASTR